MTYDWTRVKDKDTGHEYTVAVVDPDAHTVLNNKDAVDSAGVPLPGKPNISSGSKASAGKESA